MKSAALLVCAWATISGCGIAFAQSLPDCAVQLFTSSTPPRPSQITVAPGTSVTLEAHCAFAQSDPPPSFLWANGPATFNMTVAAPASANGSAQYSITVTQAGNSKSYFGKITAADSGPLIVPDSGYWWNPNEGGRGFTIERQGNELLVAAFLYDGSGRATWYAAGPAPPSGAGFTAALVTYDGGQTLTGAYRAASLFGSAGTLSLNFSSPTQGTLTWPGGTIPIQRYDIVPGGAAAPQQPVQPESGYWWAPSESGRGYAIEIQNGTMFLAGYMYDGSGNPLWYVSGPTPMTNATTYQGTWSQYSGGQTLTGSYRPPAGNATAGPVTLQFSDTLNATLTLPDGRQVAITRFRYDNGVPPLPADAPIRVSGPSPFAAQCAGAQTGTLFPNAEVEPMLAVNPLDPRNFIAVWQQDRWSDGGSQGIVTGVTFDGGATWSVRTLPFSRCAGGSIANGGDLLRASDPWVSFAPSGVAYQLVLTLTGQVLQAGSQNAMMVSRSTDGGNSWSAPITLIRDGSLFFNDKNAITADGTDARYAYAVWDRLTNDGRGPTYFSRTVDGGNTWETARPIYDPGANSQTLANQIVVLPSGVLINLFTQLDVANNAIVSSTLNLVRSTDKGATWSARVKIADILVVGATDPETGTAIRDGSTLGSIAVRSNGDLFVAWQDSRFSGGVRDGIVLSKSGDGGIAWTSPARVNGDLSVQAFMPAVAARADGTIGVSYYDFRSNTSDRATLLTDYWLARSQDGVNWSDSHVSGPFDFSVAPFAEGLFVGDYQGLSGSGANFISLFVQSGGALTDRNDVYLKVMRDAGSSFAAQRIMDSASMPVLRVDADLRRRISDNIVRSMERRIPGWSRIMLRPPR